MKAIKLQRGNKLHHYWLSQYIKAIVLHQREFEFEFWPIRKFHFIQLGPVPSTILNYCPIRWLLFHSPSWILVQSQAELPSWIIVQSEGCFPSAILHFWPIRDELPPSAPLGAELSFLHYCCHKSIATSISPGTQTESGFCTCSIKCKQENLVNWTFSHIFVFWVKTFDQKGKNHK